MVIKVEIALSCTMADVDKEWSRMLEEAVKQQQIYYELFPDWTVYKSDDSKYLKQNIAYALYGPPLIDTKYESLDDDVIKEELAYGPDVTKVVNKLFEIISAHGVGVHGDIYVGIIYNVIFRVKKESSILNVVKQQQNSNKDNEGQISAVPVFKIRKLKNSTVTDNMMPEFDHWYIDTDSRVYKSWCDYEINNKLPKCTMVYPKDGIYQHNPNMPVTETYSTVWAVAQDSPATNLKNKVANSLDVAAAIVPLSVAAATMLTPVGPIMVATGSAASVASAVWGFARSSKTLIDRRSHNESISVFNKAAFPHWLNFAGAPIAIAKVGANVLLSNVVKNGGKVRTAAKVAYNSVVVGDTIVVGMGVGMEGYHLFKTYEATGKVVRTDVFRFVSYVLFVGSTVIQVKFAEEVITSLQQSAIDEFTKSITSKRFHKAFKKVKNKAAGINNKTLENAEVIRYIKKVSSKADLFQSAQGLYSMKSSSFIPIVDNGKIKINGITLIDPLAYISDLYNCNVDRKSQLLQSSTRGESHKIALLKNLNEMLENFLNDIFSTDQKEVLENIYTVSDFETLLANMAKVDNAEEILIKLLELASFLWKCVAPRFVAFLVKLLEFLWDYTKYNLFVYVMETSKLNITNEILLAVLPHIMKGILDISDKIVENLFIAFEKYLNRTLDISSVKQ